MRPGLSTWLSPDLIRTLGNRGDALTRAGRACLDSPLPPTYSLCAGEHAGQAFLGMEEEP